MRHLFLFWLMVQGPTPETASPMFPRGGYVSYNSILAARESRPHEGIFAVAAGIRRDVQVSAQVPWTIGKSTGGRQSAIGNSIVAVKYRFLRLDSDRGTTQAAVSAGPRFSSRVGNSTSDLYLNGSFTYTGLLHMKKLVADLSTDLFLRNKEVSSRLWLSYRPYQSASGGAEWWLGPSLNWQHNVIDRGSVFAPGAATYVSPAAGTILWLGIEFPERNRRVSLGITRQFRLPGK
jgi:hypothetical protein